MIFTHLWWHYVCAFNSLQDQKLKILPLHWHQDASTINCRGKGIRLQLTAKETAAIKYQGKTKSATVNCRRILRSFTCIFQPSDMCIHTHQFWYMLPLWSIKIVWMKPMRNCEWGLLILSSCTITWLLNLINSLGSIVAILLGLSLIILIVASSIYHFSHRIL